MSWFVLILIFFFSLTIISCGDDKEEYSDDNTTTTTDTTAPVIAEVTKVTTPTNDTTPDYTFSSTEAGTISYGGSCSSSTTILISGNNTITLDSLSDGTYSDCIIVVRGTTGYLSITLTITTFIVDTTAPEIAEVTFVTTPNNDTTPDYTFSSNEAGTITYGGSCSSSTTSATSGNNTITLVSLSDGTYSDCTITVTDFAGNISNTITITSFIVDSTAATLAEVTAVTTPTNDSTPNYTFSSSEAGTITYGGSCSSSITSATTDNNTITLVSLSEGTYSNCTITVTDNSSNSVTLNISSFVIDTTAPTVSSISTTADNQSSVAITDNITVIFSEAMDTTYVTTNTDNTSCSGTLRVSSDNFSNCVQMASSPASSNSDKTFTLDPSDNLTGGTTYLTRVTTGVKDAAGNAMSSQYDNSTGFTTTSSSTQMGGSIQGNALSLTTVVTTLASSFNKPYGITTDGTNLYFADNSNHTIHKIVISSGVVTTLAGTAGSLGSTDATGASARFYQPYGITTDGTNLYVADERNNTIRKIVISSGVVTTLAGTAGTAVGSTDATGTSARFNYPSGITTDGTNLYVSDRNNHTIRQIVISSGVVTTLAGTVLTSGSTDATGTNAKFRSPSAITTDGTNLYVADGSNYRIRKIVISSGVVTTIAGSSSGSTDATGTNATFNTPSGITTDGTNLYVSDYNNSTIRQIVISSGVVTTLAGTVGTPGSTDATGTNALFYRPKGITTDGTNLYVAERGNSTIRKIQ